VLLIERAAKYFKMRYNISLTLCFLCSVIIARYMSAPGNVLMEVDGAPLDWYELRIYFVNHASLGTGPRMTMMSRSPSRL
jgi:hypothetical protein